MCCKFFSGRQFLAPSDIKRIEGAGITDFYEKKPGFSFFTLKEKEGYCVFYDHAKRKCTIYAIRPADCRFFPYDILRKGSKYYWIKWKLESADASCHLFESINDEDFLKDLEEFLPGFMEHIDEYADYTDAMIKSGESTFKLLREIRFGKKK